jgi:O-antigen/teichoic acid export membrane protein
VTGPTSRSRSGVQVAVATAVANVLAYGLSVVVSRRLGPEGFGEVAPLLAVVLVASVPGQALQAGAARRAARLGGTDPAAARLLLRAAAVGAGVVALLLVLTPAIRALLDLPGWGSLLWTAVSLLPLTLCFACIGTLQGSERFARLSAALVVLQAGRLLGGTVGVVVGGSAATTMAGTAVGLLLAAVVCTGLAAPGRPGTGQSVHGVLAGLTRDTASVLAVLVLTNLDVLLARNRLSASEAGLYAAGALVAKVAFFGPSFVAVVLYPRFSRPPDRPTALRQAALALSAATVLSVAGAAVGARLVTFVLGDAYAPLEGRLWLFAAAGSALAAVFLLVQAGLAVQDHRLAAVAWVVAVLEVVVVLMVVDDVVQLIGVVLAGATLLVVVGTLLELSSARRTPAEPDPPPPTGATVV